MSLEQMTRLAGSGNPDREKDDFYATPDWAIDALLDREKFDGEIWEPACGDGAILKLLPEHAIGKDIQHNFLNETDKYDNIITNPPFSIAYEFIKKAKQIILKKLQSLAIKASALKNVSQFLCF
jgi:hypothetical protein